MLLLGFLPSVVALLRGKLGLALFVGVVVVISIPLLALGGIGIVVWIVALFVGGLAGRKQVIVIQNGVTVPAVTTQPIAEDRVVPVNSDWIGWALAGLAILVVLALIIISPGGTLT
jgi:hypothetical protein